MYFEKLTRKRDTLIQSIRMSESQPKIFNEVSNSRLLFLIGWFGLEKFYYAKSFKKAWKFVLVKFLYSLILIGLIWNIFDIVQAFRKKYQLDFREYFR